MTIVERMRKELQPLGTAPVVQLFLADDGMTNSDFVARCIDELDNMHIRALLGERPTNLEKLAYKLLLDSAHINLEQESERENFLTQTKEVK